ncbi:MAG: glycosyltransferase family 2 protein, partial [Candidatus Sericytochromatia bacterium]
MDISVVTTLYYSENYINEFYNQIISSLKEITNDFEIIFVNDGSPDNSLEVTLELKKNDSRIKILDLSRNFGHHKAIMTGLSESKGEFVFLIDSDLEENPNLLKVFWNEINNTDFDVIYSLQKYRKGNYFEKISGFIFYKVFNFFSYIKIPESASTCRIMKRRYIDELIKFKESDLFITGVLAATGFKQKGI